MQVWVQPEVREGKLFWQADSDSALTKASTPPVPVSRWASALQPTRASCMCPVTGRALSG